MGVKIYSSLECHPTWVVTTQVAWGCNVSLRSQWKTAAQLLSDQRAVTRSLWVSYLLWSEGQTDPRWLSMKHQLLRFIQRRAERHIYPGDCKKIWLGFDVVVNFNKKERLCLTKCSFFSSLCFCAAAVTLYSLLQTVIMYKSTFCITIYQCYCMLSVTSLIIVLWWRAVYKFVSMLLVSSSLRNKCLHLYL